MSYQVIARRWRPKRFEEVVGQQGVTRTLRNAMATGRIAQAFIFAGPRGVGKTTTARILARALNCAEGPTPDPCGRCPACLEIAEGRDIDVLEIDAATHTQVEKIREVIIAGLPLAPVRDRYKIFIIDEVHQLSTSSFNALLKSMEEPPPHVVFMMATTELRKIPETIHSRSQVFEFRTIGSAAIAAQLRTIADAEGISVEDEALALIARHAEGSMRDAQSAFDQVIAFSEGRITAGEASAVLGFVGRDLLLDIVETVADENAAAVFELAERAVEGGYDLRQVCRELSRVARDLLVVSIDPSRLDDPEVASEGERERLRNLAARFSREDLMRAFDVLARAEVDIRVAVQPRYHLEMALLRWIHLRKLVPLAELIEHLEKEEPARSGGGVAPPGGVRRPPVVPPPVRRPAGRDARPDTPAAGTPLPPPAQVVSTDGALAGERGREDLPAGGVERGPDDLRDAILSEIGRTRRFFHGMVIANAQSVHLEDETLVFRYLPAQRPLRLQVEQSRSWLEPLIAKVAGRSMKVVAVEADGAEPPVEAAASAPAQTGSAEPGQHDKERLRAAALADARVQAMLDVFPAEIRDVQELQRPGSSQPGPGRGRS